MTSERPDRPAITTEERTMLQQLAPDFKSVGDVLDDLEAIGVNVERERAQLDASETLRQGLLQKFPPRRQRRKPS